MLNLNPPFRLAEKHRMGRGFRDVLSERSEFASRWLIRASQGTRRASMSGILSFGYVSLDKQRNVTRPRRAKNSAVH